MRRILLIMAAALLLPTCASAQSKPAMDLKPLFDAVQKLGNDSELRGDIAGRLGFGEDAILIKDLVINADGIQHAANAFVVSGKSYILFDSHLYRPEVYIFVKGVDGVFAAGIHGPQYAPITDTFDMKQGDATPVVGAEEEFWSEWLAAGAKAPTN